MNKVNHKAIVADATSFAGSVTPSVLVLARLAKVTPEQLAVGLRDSDKNGDFLAEFVAALISVDLKEAKKEAKAI